MLFCVQVQLFHAALTVSLFPLQRVVPLDFGLTYKCQQKLQVTSQKTTIYNIYLQTKL